MNCNWDALSAIGTIIAASVGMIGILINVFEKIKRLTVNYNFVPKPVVIVCNNSNRPVVLLKMNYFCGGHLFFSKYYSDEEEIVLSSLSAKSVPIELEKAVKSIYGLGLDKIISPSDKIELKLYDGYKRGYRIKTEWTFFAVTQMLSFDDSKNATSL